MINVINSQPGEQKRFWSKIYSYCSGITMSELCGCRYSCNSATHTLKESFKYLTWKYTGDIVGLYCISPYTDWRLALYHCFRLEVIFTHILSGSWSRSQYLLFKIFKLSLWLSSLIYHLILYKSYTVTNTLLVSLMITCTNCWKFPAL